MVAATQIQLLNHHEDKNRTTKVAGQISTSEEQLASFNDKFDPKYAALIRSVRKALRKRLPTANELVYVSIAAGASLPDPHRLLLGSGSQNRFYQTGVGTRRCDGNDFQKHGLGPLMELFGATTKAIRHD